VIAARAPGAERFDPHRKIDMQTSGNMIMPDSTDGVPPKVRIRELHRRGWPCFNSSDRMRFWIAIAAPPKPGEQPMQQPIQIQSRNSSTLNDAGYLWPTASNPKVGVRQRSRRAGERPVPPKKAPNPVDKHVGSRVRMRRMMLGISQEKLGKELRLTFQQVQKYEKGANRIGASRLQQISHILQVPVEFFFEGMPDTSSMSKADVSSLADMNDFFSSSEGLRLVAAFTRIENADLRRRIVALVQEIAIDPELGG
jgi:transcriptional regulator with XRE-family HTH domain